MLKSSSITRSNHLDNMLKRTHEAIHCYGEESEDHLSRWLSSSALLSCARTLEHDFIWWPAFYCCPVPHPIDNMFKCSTDNLNQHIAVHTTDTTWQTDLSHKAHSAGLRLPCCAISSLVRLSNFHCWCESIRLAVFLKESNPPCILLLATMAYDFLWLLWFNHCCDVNVNGSIHITSWTDPLHSETSNYFMYENKTAALWAHMILCFTQPELVSIQVGLQ